MKNLKYYFFITLLSISLLAGCGSKDPTVAATSAYTPETLEAQGISTDPMFKSSSITKEKALNLALKKYNLKKFSTKIYEEHVSLTDAEKKSSSLSDEAKKANPELTKTDTISNASVWLITFEGILEKDKKGSTIEAENNIDKFSVVIDDKTGIVLYSFGFPVEN